MHFYQLLQLDPLTLKKKIHDVDNKKEKLQLIACLFIRAILLVSFAIFWISSLNFIFGKDISSFSLILFCILLTLRFVPFGYRVGHSLVGLGIVFIILWLAPFISLIAYPFIQFILHFICLLLLFFITGKEPQMGNPGLYSFSYLYLIGTVHYISNTQVVHSFFTLLFSYGLFAIIFYHKHKFSNENISFIHIIKENRHINNKNIWYFYYAFGISLLLFLGTYLRIDRFMWSTFACSSLFSGYNTFKISERAKERVIGIFGGSILSGLLLLLIPTNYLGILGGICLGFCATYQNKTILNCIGAITSATLIFGLKTTVLLRITLNLLGVGYAFLYHLIFVNITGSLMKKGKKRLGKN